MHHLGVDLAWSEGSAGRRPRETGVAVLDADGRVLDAGWTRGVEQTRGWIRHWCSPAGSIAIDAPLVVPNAAGARDCERDVARAYGRWKVAANPTSRALPWLAGRRLAELLIDDGTALDDGTTALPAGAAAMFECYPYTTLVGAAELGYDDERPRYKRLIPGLPAAEARARRAVVCDELIARVARLPHLDLSTHPATAALLETPSPVAAAAYKHREDLLDAVLCAWTAAERRREPSRMQVLGGSGATILAICRPEQRVQPPPVPLG